MKLRDIVFALISDLENWVEYYKETGNKEALDDILSKITDLRTASFFILDKTGELLDQLEAEAKNDQATIKRVFDI